MGKTHRAGTMSFRSQNVTNAPLSDHLWMFKRTTLHHTTTTPKIMTQPLPQLQLRLPPQYKYNIMYKYNYANPPPLLHYITPPYSIYNHHYKYNRNSHSDNYNHATKMDILRFKIFPRFRQQQQQQQRQQDQLLVRVRLH